MQKVGINSDSKDKLAFVKAGGGTGTAPEPETKGFSNKCMNN